MGNGGGVGGSVGVADSTDLTILETRGLAKAKDLSDVENGEICTYRWPWSRAQAVRCLGSPAGCDDGSSATQVIYEAHTVRTVGASDLRAMRSLHEGALQDLVSWHRLYLSLTNSTRGTGREI